MTKTAEALFIKSEFIYHTYRLSTRALANVRVRFFAVQHGLVLAEELRNSATPVRVPDRIRALCQGRQVLETPSLVQGIQRLAEMLNYNYISDS